MNRDMKNKNIIQSIKCASKGIAACYREERNFREYTVIAAVFLAFNILLGAAVWEYIVFFSLVLGTFAIEYINTVIEKMIDTYRNEISDVNRFIKDTAAAGVFTFSLAFFISQALILLPKLLGAII